MLRLYLAWRLFRFLRGALLIGLIAALALAFSDGQLQRVVRAPFWRSELSTGQRDVRRAIQHALRPPPTAGAARHAGR
jgi:hypothetical protein